MTPVQVVLRWHVQQGLSAVPKSSDAGRLATNLDIFGFALADDEMAAVSALDRGGADVVDSEEFGR